MNKFFQLNVCVTILLCLATPANALLLGAGESVTFSFDFSSDAVVPPYDGYSLHVVLDLFLDPVTSSGAISYYGMDSNGPWQYPSPADGMIGGTYWYVYDFYGVAVDVGTVGFEDEDFTNDAIQFVKVWVESGSANIDQIQLRMIVRGESGGDSMTTISVDGVPTTPVPEPATMLLLGCGLFGLGAFRRRVMTWV